MLAPTARGVIGADTGGGGGGCTDGVAGGCALLDEKPTRDRARCITGAADMWQSVLSAQISDIHLSTQVSMMHERTPARPVGASGYMYRCSCRRVLRSTGSQLPHCG